MKTFCFAALYSAVAVDVPTKEIAPGVHMPVVNIGSGQIGGAKHAPAGEVVGTWLAQGGRGIDTAWIYLDQSEIAATVAESGVPRKELFITTKLAECGTGAKHYIEYNLKKLNTSYIDLLLIHFPVGNCAHTWSVMEEYHSRGILRAIGVSNFKSKNIQGLLKTAKVVPHVNQIEYNLFTHDEDTIKYCKANNITIEAYSPLGSWTPGGKPKDHKSIFSDPTIKGIAASHNVSAAQVALKWIAQRGDIMAVLSANKEHQADDADLFDPAYQLTDEEMHTLTQLQDQLVLV